MCASVLNREPAFSSVRRAAASAGARSASDTRVSSRLSRVATASLVPRSATPRSATKAEAESKARLVEESLEKVSVPAKSRSIGSRLAQPKQSSQQAPQALRSQADLQKLGANRSVFSEEPSPVLRESGAHKPKASNLGIRNAAPRATKAKKTEAPKIEAQTPRSTIGAGKSRGVTTLAKAQTAKAQTVSQTQSNRASSTHAPKSATTGSKTSAKATATEAHKIKSNAATANAATAKATNAKASTTTVKSRVGAASKALKTASQAPAGTVATERKVGVRRSRVPADLAVQYGEKEARRKPAAAEKIERRARLDARERERRRQLMTPDDDLMKRLARAGAITTSLVAHNDEGGEIRRPKAARRSRKWESRCGKCGVSSNFATPAGLCTRCGAIAVRQD